MRQTIKLASLGFSATCFCLAVDAAVGVGAAQWLADLCLTDASDDMSDMVMEPVTPLPFLTISIAMAGVGLGMLFTEDREAALGLTSPDAAEHTDILSAIVMVAAAAGKTRQQDISDVFQIATGTALEPDLAQLAHQRFQTLDPQQLRSFKLTPNERPLARRRTISAALLMGCVAHAPTRNTHRVIEHLVASIGATPEDITAAKHALTDWTTTDSGLTGLPLITLLKGKPLGLRPV